MAIPQPEKGLVNQSFRMLIRPALTATRFRLRLNHVFGKQTLRLQDLSLSWHLGGGALVPGSRVALPDMTLEAGTQAWTQDIELAPPQFSGNVPATDRSLVFSGWVEGESGPITWHAKAMVTSYLSLPHTRVDRDDGSELKFPFSTTSLFWVDAVDAELPLEGHAIVAFGDSLTDGTFTTLNGFDRWTDVLQRLLVSHGHDHCAVLNAGIGGNQILSPLSTQIPWRGGPAAIERLDRDVLSHSGVRTVIWLEGINDFSDNGNAEVEAVQAAMIQAVGKMKSVGIRVIGATLPSAFKSSREGHGSALQDQKRKAFNHFVLNSAVFDDVVDLDAVLTDHNTNTLGSTFNFDSTLGEPGDGIHPNRAGHAAIAHAVFQVLMKSHSSHHTHPVKKIP
jgi:lysophospholipase L1-like esterase